MNKPAISIIVPAYNAERFLGDMLGSIILQSFTDFEVIVVNDGSTDKTGNILVDYEARDQRIRIINKSNEGVSVARNIALGHAKGEYIYFADADDLLMPDTLQTLLKIARRYDADFVRADHQTIGAECEELFPNKRSQIRKRYGNSILNSEECYKKILLGEFFLWVCLFRRDIIIGNDIKFIAGCRFMEDAAFIVEYLTYCRSCIYIPEYVYKYRIYGATAGQAKKDYSRDLKAIQERISMFKEQAYITCFYTMINRLLNTCPFHAGNIIQLYNKIIVNIKYLLCK